MENLILDALKNTSTGNWIIEVEELETAGTNLEEFCKYLDNDKRVCEYELIDGGIDIIFWLKYCENLEEENDKKMKDEIIDTIYGKIKDSEELKSAEIEEYKNLLNENVIKIKVGKVEYVITCNKVFGEYNNY